MAYIDLSSPAMRELARRLSHRAEAVATDLRDEIVLGMDPGPGPRTGHEYPMPDGSGTYTASAPGEPPAVRTGVYAGAWQVSPPVIQGNRVVAAAVNDRRTEGGDSLGLILEFGTTDGKIAPRPHIRPAMEIVAQRWGGRIRG
jgi:hypothetical protein